MVSGPFSAAATADFTFFEEDQLIDVTSDSSLWLKLTAQPLSEFWLRVERELPLIGQRTAGILLPFVKSYLCEIGFSAVASLKTVPV